MIKDPVPSGARRFVDRRRADYRRPAVVLDVEYT